YLFRFALSEVIASSAALFAIWIWRDGDPSVAAGPWICRSIASASASPTIVWISPRLAKQGIDASCAVRAKGRSVESPRASIGSILWPLSQFRSKARPIHPYLSEPSGLADCQMSIDL